MIVGRRMTTRVVTVSPDAGVIEAWEVLQAHGIRRVPVVDGGQLVGILAEADLRVVQARGGGEGITVADVMTETVITVDPGRTVEQAAMLMADNKIGALPVVTDEDELVGIVTESDVLNTLLESMGVGEGAARLELGVPDRPGRLAPIAAALGEIGANIVSALSSLDDEGRKVLVCRVRTDDLEGVLNALTAIGVEVLSADEGREEHG